MNSPRDLSKEQEEACQSHEQLDGRTHESGRKLHFSDEGRKTKSFERSHQQITKNSGSPKKMQEKARKDQYEQEQDARWHDRN